MAMLLLGHGRTETGLIRPNNEDCFEVDNRLPLYLVADGMGGHAAGEVASRVAVATVRAEVRRECARVGKAPAGVTDPLLAEKILVAAFQAANTAIRETAASDRAMLGMGTTLTGAWCVADTLVIGHVGDTRAYLLRTTGLERLTRDHHLMAELGQEPKEDCSSALAHVLTRALGTGSEVEVDTRHVMVQGDDRILLCSDGLYSEIADDGILSIVHAARGPAQASGALVHTALCRGGRDNITAVVICAYSSLLRYWVHRLRQGLTKREAPKRGDVPDRGGNICCESP